MNISNIRKILYKTARILGDIDAINKGRVGKRIGRRIVGRVTGKGIKCLFK